MIHLRLRLLFTIFIILLVVSLMVLPVSHLDNMQRISQQNDPSRSIEPMFSLMAEGPQNAVIPVNPILDIEDCWALEDTRSYSESPLVCAMRNGDSVLGFDALSRTFYCTLGMDTQESWPELSLYAESADSVPVEIAWVDDYAYDTCADAIREGYRYELIAYTDQSYEYFGIVFTGLPIVTIHTQEDAVFSEDYIPARVCVSSAAHDAVISAAQVHLRGGGQLTAVTKKAYRLELHDLTGGADKKRREGLLGMDADSDWLLIGNASDPTAVRNSLCFDLWRRWNEGASAGNMLQDQLVEVFVRDEYMGLYQLLQRVQPEKELIRIGGNPLTDSAVRLVIGTNAGEKPTLNVKESANMWVEYRYDAENQPMRTFSRFMDFAQLSLREGKSLERGRYLSDDAFCELAEKRIPVSPMMSYFLFSQVCGFTADNVYNNLYIWILEQNNGYVYQVSPWDMDVSLPVGLEFASAMELSFYLPLRMLNLDAAGSRREIHKLWQEKRTTLLSSQSLYDWIIGTEDRINASGAYLRESEKYHGGAVPLSLSEILYYTENRLDTIERTLQSEWPVYE